MYAVIAAGGKQYKIEKGDVFTTELITDLTDKTVVINEVLLLCDGTNVKVGDPYITDAAVTCEVLGEKRAPKVIIYKYKRRKSYHKKQGHRQGLLMLKVSDIKG